MGVVTPMPSDQKITITIFLKSLTLVGQYIKNQKWKIKSEKFNIRVKKKTHSIIGTAVLVVELGRIELPSR